MLAASGSLLPFFAEEQRRAGSGFAFASLFRATFRAFRRLLGNRSKDNAENQRAIEYRKCDHAS
jgi:hypothetical protein